MCDYLKPVIRIVAMADALNGFVDRLALVVTRHQDADRWLITVVFLNFRGGNRPLEDHGQRVLDGRDHQAENQNQPNQHRWHWLSSPGIQLPHLTRTGSNRRVLISQDLWIGRWLLLNYLYRHRHQIDWEARITNAETPSSLQSLKSLHSLCRRLPRVRLVLCLLRSPESLCCPAAQTTLRALLQSSWKQAL